MIKYKILVFLLAWVGLNVCYGQNDWIPGYVIKLQGDTIHGFIENNDAKENVIQCFFRNEINSNTHNYSPEEIIGYRFIEGKFFISKKISDPEFDNPVFLEFLIKGEANIYHYLGDRYFIEKDNKIYELKNTHMDILNEVEMRDYRVEKKEYIGTLSYLLQDAKIQQDILKTELKPKPLIKIAKKYHETVCKDEECIIFEKSISPVELHIGLYSGLFLSQFSFGKLLTSKYSMGEEFGCRLELENISPWTEKLSLLFGAGIQLYSEHTFTAHEVRTSYLNYNGEQIILRQDDLNDTDILSELTVDLKTKVLKIPFKLNYALSKNKTRPYIGLGIINSFVISQNEEFIYRRFTHEYEKSIPTHHLGLSTNIGYSHRFKNNHSLFLELNYESFTSLNVNQYLRFSNQLFSLNMGYIF